MYSYEIQKWLSERDYQLAPNEYIWLINKSNSTQISRILQENGRIHIWTNDEHDWIIDIT